MPLEKTLTESMEGRDGKCGIFCKQEDGVIGQNHPCIDHDLEPCNGGIV